jgi:hypothetical protein
MKRQLWLLACLSAVFTAACGSDPSKPEEHHPKLPPGSRVGVIAFQDCIITGQEDCEGSGLLAGSVFAVEMNDQQLITVPLSRPVGPKEQLSDEAAVAYGKSKGLDYILNGEVTDFYRVAPMTFRDERAGVAVRLLRVSDGKELYFHAERDSKNNFSSPEKILRNIASDVKDDIEDN